jgi:NAD(P)-dependent dehydrogenase (short-subunit alcohol dehydrogenase family)
MAAMTAKSLHHETVSGGAALKDPRDQGPKGPHPAQTQDGTGRESEMTPLADHGEGSYQGHDRLLGRVALITGGDSGIGRAVALAFAREGADVVINYLESHDDAAESQRLVQGAGRAALTVAADVGDEEACRRLVDATVARFGRVDILVNNAAYQGKAVERFEDLDAARVDRTFRTNIIGMFHLVRLCLPHMRPGASVINTSSVQAYSPTPPILDYATTKGAIVPFTKGLALSLIERGIRVNCVAPGPVWTPLVVASFTPEKVAEFGMSNPMKRAAQPAELASAFVFLASDDARFVNGEVLGVTGGRPLG